MALLRFLLLSLLLPILGICLSSKPSSPISNLSTCGVSEHEHSLWLAKSIFNFQVSESRVVGGKESPPHAWPWIVEILLRGGHRCGGTLIDKQIVLTAAHCFTKTRSPRAYTVILGAHRAHIGQTFRVKSIRIHPWYHALGPNTFDFALLRLLEPVKLSSDVKLACLPVTVAPSNRICVIAGWGSRMERGRGSETLREAHIPLIPIGVCNDWRHFAGRVNPTSMVCAGYDTGEFDSCQGDSGGPLLCVNPSGQWEVQGVVSWGVGCGRPNFPGVYAKVIAALPWIHREMTTRLRVEGGDEEEEEDEEEETTVDKVDQKEGKEEEKLE